MAPVAAGDTNISSTSAIPSSTSTLQLALGITLPLLAVASFIPIIMIKRHLATRHIISQRSTTCAARSAITTAATSCHVQGTPRLPMASVYIARVDYYLPPSETGISQAVAESQQECDIGEGDSVSSSMDGEEGEDNKADAAVASAGIGLMPTVPPMVSLPSLSSMLCEFTAYADVIEPENLSEARRSSTCLLDSVFSSKDVKALSFTELPVSPSLPPIHPVTSALSLNFESTSAGRSFFEGKWRREELCAHPGLLGETPSSPFFRDRSSVAEEPDFSRAHECEVDIEAIVPPQEDEVEEIDTSQLASTTTICSLALDSSSTLASLLAVRLSQFPPVPALPPLLQLGFAGRSLITRTSQSSLGSTVTCSLSAPASLNILEIQLNEALPPTGPIGPLLENWPSFSNPGELWDKEDDLLFSVCVPKKPITPSKPIRHTWTAGIRYSRSDKGDLWDDEDDRRFSFAGGEMKPGSLDIFVSGSMFSLEMSTGHALADSTLYMSEGSSLADHSRKARAIIESGVDQTTLCCYSEIELNFIDTGFTEADLCFDFAFSSFKEQGNMKSGPSCEEGEEPCSPFGFGFGDLGDGSRVGATAIYLSESSRSSLMSLASVLDIPIRVEDPPSPSPAPSLTGIFLLDDISLSGSLLEVLEAEVLATAADTDVDMELEPDVSYCSRIISVNHPLFREECETDEYLASAVTEKASRASPVCH